MINRKNSTIYGRHIKIEIKQEETHNGQNEI